MNRVRRKWLSEEGEDYDGPAVAAVYWELPEKRRRDDLMGVVFFCEESTQWVDTVAHEALHMAIHQIARARCVNKYVMIDINSPLPYEQDPHEELARSVGFYTWQLMKWFEEFREPI